MCTRHLSLPTRIYALGSPALFRPVRCGDRNTFWFRIGVGWLWSDSHVFIPEAVVLGLVVTVSNKKFMVVFNTSREGFKRVCTCIVYSTVTMVNTHAESACKVISSRGWCHYDVMVHTRSQLLWLCIWNLSLIGSIFAAYVRKNLAFRSRGACGTQWVCVSILCGLLILFTFIMCSIHLHRVCNIHFGRRPDGVYFYFTHAYAHIHTGTHFFHCYSRVCAGMHAHTPTHAVTQLLHLKRTEGGHASSTSVWKHNVVCVVVWYNSSSVFVCVVLLPHLCRYIWRWVLRWSYPTWK